MTRLARLPLAVLLALLVLAPAASAKRVRVFAVGPKFELRWVESREHFRAKLLALTDRSLRDKTTAPVQRGADDVASQLLGPTDRARALETARDLVVFPEDLGLFAALTGTRAEPARRASSLTEAIASLLASYSDVSAYYAARFPSLSRRPPPPTRLLNVALTDTFARVAVETFAELADRYDSYLAAGVNMVTSWQVVCIDRSTYVAPPGAPPCAEEDAAKVARLRSPDEPARTYAYEAVNPDASNMALLFDPAGRLISKQIKSYPTPTEAPGLLDLRPGPVTGLQALDTPVGRLGFVTSRDAFMPDVVQRLDQQRVEILVQPEFFVNDIVQTRGMWSPDTLKSSGFSALQRLASIDALVLPALTGNIYEFAADAQQHIALKPRSTRAPRGGLVGQDPEAGFVQVQSWLVRDPLRPGEPMAERRQRLGEAGEAAAGVRSSEPCRPSDVPGPCRGGQVEGVLVQDVHVDVERRRRPRPRRARGRTPFGLSRPIAPSRNAQRNVTLAARGRRVWAAFEERRGRLEQILLVRSSDGGRTWSRPRRPVARPAGAHREWWPSLDAGPDGTLWLAWQDDSSGTHRVHVARSVDGGRRFSAPLAVDARPAPDVPQWKPSVAATGPRRAFVAWVDERDPVPGEEGLREAGLFGTLVQGGRAEPAVRLDGGETAELARNQDSSWSPSVTARGSHVLVSWMDLRTYDWRIYARESRDGGVTFGDERPVQDTPPVKTDPILPPENEALNADPSSVITSAGRAFVAFTDFRKEADTARRPHQLFDTMLGVPGGADVQVDPHGRAQVSTYFPAAVALPRTNDVLVAWQDMRAGPADVHLARVRDGVRPGRAVRIDDSGSAGWNQWRPRLAAIAGRRVLAAWEDERDGPANVFAARASLRRLR